MSRWRRNWDRSEQPRNLGQLKVALQSKWVQIPKNAVQHYVLSIRPLYDAVIASGEGHALYWTNLNQVNRFRRERDIHSSVKNLSFLKMTVVVYDSL